MDGYRCSSWCDSSFSSIVTLKKARCLDVKGLINRRCRQLPLSVTSSKLVPERDTSWMRDALMGSKDCSREEEIREGGGNCDSSSNAVYGNIFFGKGDMLLVTTKKHGQSGDKLQYKAIGRVFGRAQFVVSNKGDWCSAVWAHCPIAG